MSKLQQITQQIILLSLTCFFIISFSVCILGWTAMDGLIPPPKNILLLMLFRAALISFILILSALTLVQYFHKGKLVKRVIIWVIPVVAVTMLILVLLLPIENKLRLISCCGETNPSFWGYPFGWVECDGNSFCGLDKGGVHRSLAIANFWVGINLMICVIGFAENIFNHYKMVAYAKQTSTRNK